LLDQYEIIYPERRPIHFVYSLYPCSVPGCFNEAIISNSGIENGLRCLEHAPKSWIEEARKFLIERQLEFEKRERIFLI